MIRQINIPYTITIIALLFSVFMESYYEQIAIPYTKLLSSTVTLTDRQILNDPWPYYNTNSKTKIRDSFLENFSSDMVTG